MIRFVKRHDLTAEAWDAIVAGSDDGWVFGLSGWQDLILAVSEWALVECSFALEWNGRLIAVVPLQFNPNTQTLGLSAWGGCGPVLVNDLTNSERTRALSEIYTHCAAIGSEHGARSMEFQQMAVTGASLANARGINFSLFHGFEDLSGLTQVIALDSDPDKLWAGLSKNARNIIRRAEKSGLRAERVDWLEHLPRYYDLHCETYNRTGVHPHPRAYFAGIAEKMALSGHAALFAALDTEDRVVAYHNDAWFRGGALYHTGCSSDDAQDRGANYLLLWKAILAARESGKSHYEVGPIFPTSTDRKQQGLTLFKTRFGGEPHRAFRSRRMLQVEADATVTASSGSTGGVVSARRRLGGLLRRIAALGNPISKSEA